MTAMSANTNAEESFMKIRFTFGEDNFTASLHDNPSARDFVSMLPLNIKIEDYSNNEKITYLPRKLTTEGSSPFGNERPGDLCYYAPWGDIVFFYANYRYSSGLIRLGRLDSGIQPLLTRGEFPLRIELL
uniref:cyclophilin-like fold protein n=1 Tax=Neorhizobium sp. EC2-8 TaxID=3129230 RepID=UPI0031017FE7